MTQTHCRAGSHSTPWQEGTATARREEPSFATWWSHPSASATRSEPSDSISMPCPFEPVTPDSWQTPVSASTTAQSDAPMRSRVFPPSRTLTSEQ